MSNRNGPQIDNFIQQRYPGYDWEHQRKAGNKTFETYDMHYSSNGNSAHEIQNHNPTFGAKYYE
jgi:hypothetical protein